MSISQLSVSKDEDILSEEDVDRILKTYQNPLQLQEFIMEGIISKLYSCSLKLLPVSDQQFTPRGVETLIQTGRVAHRTLYLSVHGLKKQFCFLLAC